MTSNMSDSENDLDESCVFCFIASGQDKEAEVVKNVSVFNFGFSTAIWLVHVNS